MTAHNYGEIGDTGYLRIDGSEERIKVAAVLLQNGYTVSVVRRKRNGKSFEYFLKYELKSREMEET